MNIVLLDKEEFQRLVEETHWVVDTKKSAKVSANITRNSQQLRTITLHETIYVELK